MNNVMRFFFCGKHKPKALLLLLCFSLAFASSCPMQKFLSGFSLNGKTAAVATGVSAAQQLSCQGSLNWERITLKKVATKLQRLLPEHRPPQLYQKLPADGSLVALAKGGRNSSFFTVNNLPLHLIHQVFII